MDEFRAYVWERENELRGCVKYEAFVRSDTRFLGSRYVQGFMCVNVEALMGGEGGGGGLKIRSECVVLFSSEGYMSTYICL